MKNKTIVTVVIALIILIVGGICYTQYQKPKHTVSDFAPYPCPFVKSDKIDIISTTHQMTLLKSGERWMISSPWQEPMNDEALTSLVLFLTAKMFIDERREVTPDERAKLSVENPTKVSFFEKDQTLCSFELGRGYKLPEVDSERRWIFPDGDSAAYRTFVPLMDFASIFEQHPAGWRQLMLLSLATSSIESVEIKSIGESYRLERGGQKSSDNPLGWRITQATRNGIELDINKFRTDYLRISTLMELVTPFYIDDWADQIPPEEKMAIAYNGEIVFASSGEKFTVQIGSEIDRTKHPEWNYLGEGARYIRLQGMNRIGVISMQRLMGVFPSLDDMRNLKVWEIDVSQLSEIEINDGENCTQYVQRSPNQWTAIPCIIDNQGDTDKQKTTVVEVPTEAMSRYLRVLSGIEAVRYAAPAESVEQTSQIDLTSTTIKLFQRDTEGSRKISRQLQFGPSNNPLYRYGRIIDNDTETNEDLPPFVLPEINVRLLLSGPTMDKLSN